MDTIPVEELNEIKKVLDVLRPAAHKILSSEEEKQLMACMAMIMHEEFFAVSWNLGLPDYMKEEDRDKAVSAVTSGLNALVVKRFDAEVRRIVETR